MDNRGAYRRRRCCIFYQAQEKQRLLQLPAWQYMRQKTTQEMNAPVGRFAPSPTGRMHLGNVFAALMSWLSVRSRGGKWILRIEDLDPQRSKL